MEHLTPAQERILFALGDLKSEISSMSADMRSVDRRMDAIHVHLADHRTGHNKVVDRVDAIERANLRIKAAIGAISAFLGVAGSSAAWAYQHFPLK